MATSKINIENRTTPTDKLQAVKDARLGLKLADVTFKRALQDANSAGISQQDIARFAGISQPAVSKHLSASTSVNPVVPGFSGADPLEICERYHLGQLSEDQLFDELTRWEYLPEPEDVPLIDDTLLTRGTWADIEIALSLEYITSEQYAKLYELLDDDQATR